MKSDEYETTTFIEDIIYSTVPTEMYDEFLSFRQNIEIRKEFPESWIFVNSEKYEEFGHNSFISFTHNFTLSNNSNSTYLYVLRHKFKVFIHSRNSF